MVLRCAKDSVNSTLPVETDTDVVKLKDKKNKDIITVYEKDETEITTSKLVKGNGYIYVIWENSENRC